MSREDLESASDDRLDVMRQCFDRWNGAEFDAIFDLYDDDAELITDPSFVEAGAFKGLAAIKGWFEGLTDGGRGRLSLLPSWQGSGGHAAERRGGRT